MKSRIFYAEGTVHAVFMYSLIQAFVTTIAFSIPIMCASVAFVIYSISNPLNPGAVFAALSWFYILRFPLMFLPAVMVGFADYRVAITRFQELFLAEELQESQARVADASDAVVVKDASFVWDFKPMAESKPGLDSKPTIVKVGQETPIELVDVPKKDDGFFKLEHINLTVPKGALIAIVGTVGSGKSSILNGIIGEMKKTDGQVQISGSIGYCPQQAWIQNSTLKENITFGLSFDRTRYYKAIRDCALEKDLEALPDGDMTQIGERGINLSGKFLELTFSRWTKTASESSACRLL